VGAKLGVGLLGVGEMGRRHAENFARRVPEAQLVAIADVALGRAKEVAEVLSVEHVFASVEELVACKEVQAVVIAAPDKFHAGAIATAAAAGKAILCEKPLALTLEDANRALEAVAKAGVPLQVGFMRHYDPAYVAAMRRIEGGEIGEPVIFKSVGRDRDEPPLAALQSGINGMLLYTNTIHDFDLARWMMRDEVIEVHTYSTVAVRPQVAQYGDVVAGTVNLKYSRGAIGNIESFAQAVYAYDVRTEVLGSKGAVFIGTVNKSPAVFLTKDGATQVLEDHFLSRFADAYVLEAQDFVHNVLHDKPLQVTGENGIKSLQIAVAAERSHKSGQPCLVRPS
jgi:predicted dehydrogenase